MTTVLHRTRGNPFFVTEIVRLLAADTGSADAGSFGSAVPTGVRGVIRQRVARLSEEARPCLDDAAVLGHDFDLGDLAAVVGDDAATLLERLEPAFAAGILVDSPAGPGRYRFSHGLVHETVYGDLPAARRARIHHRAAVALEARHGVGPGPHLIAVAVHWFQAVPAAAPEPGIDAAVRAAHWAQAHVAHQQATEQLRAALELVARLPGTRDRDVRELQLQDQLDALLILTRGYSADGVDVACARMRELCATVDDHTLLLPSLWRLSIIHCVTLDLDTALDLGHQLLALAGPEGEPSLLLAGHMALGVASTQRGAFDVAQGHLDAAVALCRAGADAAMVGAVLETPGVWARVFSGWNEWMLGRTDAAEDLCLEAVGVGAAEGPESYPIVFAIWFTALMAALDGRADDVIARSDDGMGRAAASGYAMFVPLMAAVPRVGDRRARRARGGRRHARRHERRHAGRRRAHAAALLPVPAGGRGPHGRSLRGGARLHRRGHP